MSSGRHLQTRSGRYNGGRATSTEGTGGEEGDGLAREDDQSRSTTTSAVDRGSGSGRRTAHHNDVSIDDDDGGLSQHLTSSTINELVVNDDDDDDDVSQSFPDACAPHALVAEEAKMKHEKDMATMVVEALINHNKMEIEREETCMKIEDDSARHRAEMRLKWVQAREESARPRQEFARQREDAATKRAEEEEKTARH